MKQVLQDFSTYSKTRKALLNFMNSEALIASRSMETRIAAIIVNWNGGQETIGCLRSLLTLNRHSTDLSVAVVDNDSADDSIREILDFLVNQGYKSSPFAVSGESARRIKDVTLFSPARASQPFMYLIRAYENYGFAAANNIGMELVRGNSKPTYFWFLNNDTAVDENALAPLIEKMTMHPDIGICGSTILYASDRQTVQAYGGAYYSLRTGRGWAFGMGARYDPNVTDHLAEANINFISGAAMFVRATALTKVGPMCEDYFLYNEEIDLSTRGKGIFLLGVATKSIVYHMVGASIGSEKGEGVGSRLATFYQARSKLLFAKKHTPQYLPMVWIVLFARAVKFTTSPLTRRNAVVILSVLFGRRQVDARWFAERTKNNPSLPGVK